jgi:hypothetical protein
VAHHIGQGQGLSHDWVDCSEKGQSKPISVSKQSKETSIARGTSGQMQMDGGQSIREVVVEETREKEAWMPELGGSPTQEFLRGLRKTHAQYTPKNDREFVPNLLQELDPPTQQSHQRKEITVLLDALRSLVAEDRHRSALLIYQQVYDQIFKEFENRHSALMAVLGNGIERRDRETLLEKRQMQEKFARLEEELRLAVNTAKMEKEDIQGTFSRLEQTHGEVMDRLLLEKEDLQERFTALNRHLIESEERCRGADQMIIDLERRLREGGSAHLEEVRELVGQIAVLKNEKLLYEQQFGKQNQKLSVQIVEKQRNLDQVNAELLECNRHLSEAMTVISEHHPGCHFWEKFGIWILIILGVPTIIGTVKALEWLESIEKPLEIANQTILRKSVEIAGLNRIREMLISHMTTTQSDPSFAETRLAPSDHIAGQSV